jgi:hypothetical protein
MIMEKIWKSTSKTENVLASSLPITRQVNKIPAVIYFEMIDTLGLPCNNKTNKINQTSLYKYCC